MQNLPRAEKAAPYVFPKFNLLCYEKKGKLPPLLGYEYMGEKGIRLKRDRMNVPHHDLTSRVGFGREWFW